MRLQWKVIISDFTKWVTVAWKDKVRFSIYPYSSGDDTYWAVYVRDFPITLEYYSDRYRSLKQAKRHCVKYAERLKQK